MKHKKIKTCITIYPEDRDFYQKVSCGEKVNNGRLSKGIEIAAKVLKAVKGEI